MPGLGLSLGITLTWLGLIVLIPLLGIFIKTSGLVGRVCGGYGASRACCRHCG